MTQYIGIDISKNKINIAWLKDASKLKVKTKVLNNNQQGFNDLINWIHTHISDELTDLHICMEATGVYHENLAYYLQDKGITISIINPAFIKRYSEALGTRSKTDKQDSIVIARYAHSTHPKPWIAPPAHARHLKSLLSRLDALHEDLQREKNRQEKAQATDTAPIVKQSIEQMIASLETAISKLGSDIDNHINEHPDLKQDQILLTSIKGVGTTLSRQMLSLMHNKQFNKASQMAAFLGLVPKQHQSGVFKGHSRLAKNGSSQVRAKLFMPALVAIKHNPDVKAHYVRLLAHGKCKMQAVCAAMRKLVHICFGVVKHQTPYTPRVNLSMVC